MVMWRFFLSITIMLLILFPPSFISSNLLAEAGRIPDSLDLDRVESITEKTANIKETSLAVNGSELPAIDLPQYTENWLDFVSRKLRGLLWGVTRGIQHHPLKSWLAELESHHLTRSEEVSVEVEPNAIA
jgi:hypothetical protein